MAKDETDPGEDRPVDKEGAEGEPRALRLGGNPPEEVARMRDALRNLEEVTPPRTHPMADVVNRQVEMNREVRREQLDRDEVQRRQLEVLKSQADRLEGIRTALEEAKTREISIIVIASLTLAATVGMLLR